jgi:hypothetical protein
MIVNFRTLKKWRVLRTRIVYVEPAQFATSLLDRNRADDARGGGNQRTGHGE